MKHFLNVIPLFAATIVAASCTQHATTDQTTATIPDSSIITVTVLTKDQQAKLSPDSIIASLKEGNQDFIEDKLTIRNNSERIREAALGQYPKAVVLSCLDSRVPVEDVFHKGIGDLFVARVAGNIVNEDILGSLEYACNVSGSKVVVVLGHEYCGAIKSAADDVKFGNITPLLAKIKPAVQNVRSTFKGDTSSKNEGFIEAVCKENVLLTIQNIHKQSPALSEMEQEGKIKIIGAIYHMKSGKVDFL
ncbi:carbonic anhydrase family protein [Mucilaginibacter agri]|uniref:Carbonic anhydrase n=1 Tax=Mucilaginibacter agri TaxID=2695265 RepID=A0A965ZJF5_9SPHI|nr:carbonic anhydrase family protein [Mucilaginibacter agri]NCD72259.1 carbonic anhydrase [Mucilaginibacter agri]